MSRALRLLTLGLIALAACSGEAPQRSPSMNEPSVARVTPTPGSTFVPTEQVQEEAAPQPTENVVIPPFRPVERPEQEGGLPRAGGRSYPRISIEGDLHFIASMQGGKVTSISAPRQVLPLGGAGVGGYASCPGEHLLRFEPAPGQVCQVKGILLVGIREDSPRFYDLGFIVPTASVDPVPRLLAEEHTRLLSLDTDSVFARPDSQSKYTFVWFGRLASLPDGNKTIVQWSSNDTAGVTAEETLYQGNEAVRPTRTKARSQAEEHRWEVRQRQQRLRELLEKTKESRAVEPTSTEVSEKVERLRLGLLQRQQDLRNGLAD